MSDSIFTKIITGVIPCYKIYEDDTFFAFLDINPVSWGHTLLVPKKQTDYFFDMDAMELSKIMGVAKQIADKLKIVTDCQRVGITVIGFEVPHAHLHLIPMNGLDDMDFKKPKLHFSKESLEKLASEIRLV